MEISRYKLKGQAILSLDFSECVPSYLRTCFLTYVMHMSLHKMLIVDTS